MGSIETKTTKENDMPETEFPVYMGKEPFLFVSYSHVDWRCVNGILRILFREGFRVWYDEQADGIPVGAGWKEVIDERISSCQVFVVFLSNGVEERYEVLREFDEAREQKKAIIPIFLQRVPLCVFSDQLRETIENTQHIDLWKYEGVTMAFAKRLLSSPALTVQLIDAEWRQKQGLPNWIPERVNVQENEYFYPQEQYIYPNANPRFWNDEDSEDGISFYQISPGETDPEAVYPLAMDNQWCPNWFYEDARFWKEGFASETLLEEKQALQRTEFYRGLLHSLQVIINRAFLQNSPIFLNWYQSGASKENRTAFGRLLESGAIVIFLYHEDTPCEIPKYGTGDLSEWQRFCQEYSAYCLRMDWQDKETNQKETSIQLNLAFHKYCVTTAEDMYQIENMANYFQLTEVPRKTEQFRECWKQIQTAALCFYSNHIGTGYTREEFYKDFLVERDTKVERCLLRKNGLFNQELKSVIDLRYNWNMAQALGLKLLIPNDMKDLAEAVTEETVFRGQREVSVEELIYAIRSFSTCFLQTEVWAVENPDLNIAQVEKMRAIVGWREYVRAKEASQKRSRQWDIDFYDIATVWERYQRWMQNVKNAFPELHWRKSMGAISLIYRFGGKEWKAVYRAGADEPEWAENHVRIGIGKVLLTIDYVCGDAMDLSTDSCLQTEIRFFEGATHENGVNAAQAFWEKIVKREEYNDD